MTPMTFLCMAINVEVFTLFFTFALMKTKAFSWNISKALRSQSWYQRIYAGANWEATTNADLFKFCNNCSQVHSGFPVPSLLPSLHAHPSLSPQTTHIHTQYTPHSHHTPTHNPTTHPHHTHHKHHMHTHIRACTHTHTCVGSFALRMKSEVS